MKLRWHWLALPLLAVASPAFAQDGSDCGTGPVSGERVALLVGNDRYDSPRWPALGNPVNDVERVCEVLTSAGFAVRLVRDAPIDAMREAFDRFAADARGARSVVIYFAGHGFEYAGRNYIVPTDGPASATPSEIDSSFISLEGLVISAIPQGAFGLLFIDACRTAEPVIEISLDDEAANRVAPVGLLGIDQGAVLYSTAKGRPALDAAPLGSPNSPFADAVTRRIGTPGIELSDFFRIVARDVFAVTRAVNMGPQQPFHYGSWFEDFYFVPPAEVGAGVPAAAPAEAPPPPPSADRTSPDRADAPAETTQPPATPTRAADLEPLGMSFDVLAINDEPVVVANILARRSVADIQALAERGDADAQHIFGYMLHYGVGVRRDVAAARRWLEASAYQTYAPGQLELAHWLMENEPDTAALERAETLYRAAVAAEYSKAYTHLAQRLASGAFGPPDAEEARRWYLYAADDGHAAAMFALTRYPQHRQDMIDRLTRLADAGDPEGAYWLCETAFDSGSVATAIDHCAFAARAGYAGARAILARAYADGTGVARDPAEGVYWARLARSQPELLGKASLIADIPGG
jgi:uncharacterized protein